jgi:hypothetical protein
MLNGLSRDLPRLSDIIGANSSEGRRRFGRRFPADHTSMVPI